MLIGPAGLRGAMAQLVARLVRNEKVRGSSPLSSTESKCHLTRVQRSPFLTQSMAVRRSRRLLMRVMITSPTLARFPSAKRHLRCCRGVIEPMRAGTGVQFGDQVQGGRDHDHIEPSRSIRNPRVERILARGGYVADMDPAVIKVEVECLGVALAEGE